MEINKIEFEQLEYENKPWLFELINLLKQDFGKNNDDLREEKIYFEIYFELCEYIDSCLPEKNNRLEEIVKYYDANTKGEYIYYAIYMLVKETIERELFSQNQGKKDRILLLSEKLLENALDGITLDNSRNEILKLYDVKMNTDKKSKQKEVSLKLKKQNKHRG